MDAYQIYLIGAVVILAIVAIFVYFTGRRKPKQGLSRLAALAFIFIVAGIIFGEYQLVGYSLLGIGLFLALIDIYIKLKGR
jgi:uncharacterized membrane protein